jgi:hypothetical protein
MASFLCWTKNLEFAPVLPVPMEQSPFWEANSSATSHTVWNQSFITLLTRACHLTLFWHTTTDRLWVLKIQLNVVLRVFPEWPLFFSSSGYALYFFLICPMFASILSNLTVMTAVWWCCCKHDCYCGHTSSCFSPNTFQKLDLLVFRYKKGERKISSPVGTLWMS